MAEGEDRFFSVLTSLRWVQYLRDAQNPDIIVTDLRLHRDRLSAAAEAFNWSHVFNELAGEDGIRLLYQAVQQHMNSTSSARKQIYTDCSALVLKLRILVSEDARLSVDSSVVSPNIDESPELNSNSTLMFHHLQTTSPPTHDYSKVYIDTDSTSPSSFTRHKTTFRKPYDKARSRAGISHSGPLDAEVLLWNHAGEISEASLSTPYFRRGDKWITPSLTCGGNAGVTRRESIEANFCEEGVVRVDDILAGEYIWLSNAVRGFFWGRIQSSQTA